MMGEWICLRVSDLRGGLRLSSLELELELELLDLRYAVG